MANATAVIWRMPLVAETRFRRLHVPELLREVRLRVRYVDGVFPAWAVYTSRRCRRFSAADPTGSSFFYSGDRKEPPHVHVERDDSLAKFWLNPVRLQKSGGFSRAEIHKVEALVVKKEPRESLAAVKRRLRRNGKLRAR